MSWDLLHFDLAQSIHWDALLFDLAQSIQWNALLLFGGLLLGGLIGGHIVTRTNWVPRITGYLLVGFLLGAGGLNLLSGDVLRLSTIFADIALALLVYQLGRYVDFGWLRYEKWLLLTVFSSAVLCFLFVWLALERFGTARVPAMLAGVFAIGIAPAVVMVVVRDLGAEGHVTRRLAAMTALTNLLALLVAYSLFPIVANEARTPLLQMISGALYSLCGSLLLAYLTYRIMIPLARMLGRERSGQFVLVIAIITLVIGAAHALQLPVLLTMLAFAIFSKNLDQEHRLMELEFGMATELFVAVLFVTIGASLQVADLIAAAIPVGILIGARFAAMACAIFAFARPAKLGWTQAGLLMLGALPLAETGLALGQISALYPETAAAVAPLVAGSVVVLELLGPIATQFALIKSGEGGHERLQASA